MRELQGPIDLVRALADKVNPRKREPTRGGSANIGPMETIAGDNCWCGRPQDHDWTLKEDGAPHPRYPD